MNHAARPHLRSRRVQILAYLAEAELSTSDLTARFSMTAPAILRHLSVLENAGSS